jgi:hypothetical protein
MSILKLFSHTTNGANQFLNGILGKDILAYT